ncbi:MAG: hypothetical protein HAW62_00575 [Endozoicomonadaceae bacterium]|nr:hypothetical protein [Endozoicomonadaceae bacterium]
MTILCFLLFNQAISGIGKSKLTRTSTLSDPAILSDSVEFSPPKYKYYVDTNYFKYFTCDGDDPVNKVTLSYCSLVDISDNYLVYLVDSE